MSTLYRVRTIASTWGIAIDFYAHFEPITEVHSIKVSNGISLEFSEKVCNFARTDLLTCHFEVGVDAFLEDFPETKSQLETQAIVVDDLSWSDCDFQFEGLSCAIAGWLCEEFGKQPEPLFLVYDASLNRYLLRRRRDAQ